MARTPANYSVMVSRVSKLTLKATRVLVNASSRRSKVQEWDWNSVNKDLETGAETLREWSGYLKEDKGRFGAEIESDLREAICSEQAAIAIWVPTLERHKCKTKLRELLPPECFEVK